MARTRGIDISEYVPSRFKSGDTNGEGEQKESSNQEEPGDQKNTDGNESNRESTGTGEPSDSKTGSPKTSNPNTEGSDSEISGSGGSATESAEPDEKINPLLTEGVLQAAAGLHSEAGSARTTFCLSREARTLFKDLSSRSGRPQKGLLRTALRLCQEAWQGRPDRLQDAAHRFQAGREFENGKRMPMAIAPGVREGLNDLAETTGLPRDPLVEVGIRLAQAALKEQVERLIRPHEDILPDLRALREDIEEARAALSDHEKRRGPELPDQKDPVESGLSDLLGTIGEMTEAIEAEIESRQPIEEDRQFI